MKYRITIYIAVLIGTLYLVSTGGMKSSFSPWKDYLSVLLTMSGMIFTVMGLWIAIIYPNALQKIAEISPEQKLAEGTISTARNQFKEDTDRLESLVIVVLLSAGVVVGVATIFLLRAILLDTAIYTSNHEIFRVGAIEAAVLLGCIQVESVFRMMKSNIDFLLHLHDKKQDKDADNDI